MFQHAYPVLNTLTKQIYSFLNLCAPSTCQFILINANFGDCPTILRGKKKRSLITVTNMFCTCCCGSVHVWHSQLTSSIISMEPKCNELPLAMTIERHLTSKHIYRQQFTDPNMIIFCLKKNTVSGPWVNLFWKVPKSSVTFAKQVRKGAKV